MSCPRLVRISSCSDEYISWSKLFRGWETAVLVTVSMKPKKKRGPQSPGRFSAPLGLHCHDRWHRPQRINHYRRKASFSSSRTDGEMHLARTQRIWRRGHGQQRMATPPLLDTRLDGRFFFVASAGSVGAPRLFCHILAIRL